jgi:hypothetical protein
VPTLWAYARLAPVQPFALEIVPNTALFLLTSFTHFLRLESVRQMGELQADELQAGVELALAVFPQSSVLLQPSETALNHPALGSHGKGV